MQIRGYRAGDYKAMHSLHVQCIPRPWGLENMKKIAEEESAMVLFAESGDLNAMVGFVLLHLHESSGQPYSNVCILGKYARISLLNVLPEAGFDEIAPRMLTYAEEQARAAGARSILVELHMAKNEFYTRQKYIQVVYEDEFFYGGREDGWVFIKPL